jgi:hypothetical protein
MATSFTKTYQVTVTFTKDSTSPDLADTDIQAVELRAEIKKRIEEVSRRSKGVYQTQPGTVSET